MDVQITPELVTSIGGLLGAIGLFVKQIRDNNHNRRRRHEDRERDKQELAEVARAAAEGKAPELVENFERTGEFRRPTRSEMREAARARARQSAERDT